MMSSFSAGILPVKSLGEGLGYGSISARDVVDGSVWLSSSLGSSSLQRHFNLRKPGDLEHQRLEKCSPEQVQFHGIQFQGNSGRLAHVAYEAVL
jgi:hypothetical protein